MVWRCHAGWAGGGEWTAPMVTAEPCAWVIGSTYTSPVNHSAGPLAVGCLGWTSILEFSFGASRGFSRQLCGLAAVDDERVADRERGLVGAEPEDGRCDLLG